MRSACTNRAGTRRSAAIAGAAVLFVAAAVACTTPDASLDGAAVTVTMTTVVTLPPSITATTTTTVAPSTGSGAATTSSSGATTATVTVQTTVPRTRSKLDGFGEVTVTVTAADGQSRTWCLLLADTGELRAQGLMRVDDPTLGGFDGMLFSFPGDTEGGFWMKNTLLPLSIAYLRADGSTTSITDMTPCPASSATCPSYPSGGTYRYAIEVPQGGLGRLGISDRSKVEVGQRSCPAPA